jgi:hypothetical protein
MILWWKSKLNNSVPHIDDTLVEIKTKDKMLFYAE